MTMEKKSMAVPFIIYADIESLLDKIVTCHNNLEKSSAAEINKHTAHLMPQKSSMIITETKTYEKVF